ncbi:MAG: dihydroorotate dehydrogenase electron transfer subunit [Candidatus Omnitrophica bacterium]|nr:dihydroorotate dehydrogenase electron transfer subunit [Candidatus Omnitrophota bacterium]
MKQFKAKVISNKKIAKDHYILSFKAAGLRKKVKPGQFFNVKVNNSYKPLLRKPFGAHKITRKGIEILYKVVGEATEILSTKKKGDVLDVLGPLGNGFDFKSTAHSSAKTGTGSPQPVVATLVAGGHGVAPLAALGKELSDAGHKLSVFIGARSKKEVVCEKDFRKIGAKVFVATEDGSKGYKGLVTNLLKNKLRHTTYDIRDTIYACGPNPMLKEVAKLAKRYKIPCQVSLEEYIACGTGTCLGCAVKTRSGYRLVCKDGPVFDAKEIIWR